MRSRSKFFINNYPFGFSGSKGADKPLKTCCAFGDGRTFQNGKSTTWTDGLNQGERYHLCLEIFNLPGLGCITTSRLPQYDSSEKVQSGVCLVRDFIEIPRNGMYNGRQWTRERCRITNCWKFSETVQTSIHSRSFGI